jgi:hypothetical protein
MVKALPLGPPHRACEQPEHSGHGLSSSSTTIGSRDEVIETPTATHLRFRIAAG